MHNQNNEVKLSSIVRSIIGDYRDNAQISFEQYREKRKKYFREIIACLIDTPGYLGWIGAAIMVCFNLYANVLWSFCMYGYDGLISSESSSVPALLTLIFIIILGVSVIFFNRFAVAKFEARQTTNSNTENKDQHKIKKMEKLNRIFAFGEYAALFICGIVIEWPYQLFVIFFLAVSLFHIWSLLTTGDEGERWYYRSIATVLFCSYILVAFLFSQSKENIFAVTDLSILRIADFFLVMIIVLWFGMAGSTIAGVVYEKVHNNRTRAFLVKKPDPEQKLQAFSVWLNVNCMIYAAIAVIFIGALAASTWSVVQIIKSLIS